MQTWRRTFATSVARLNHNPPTSATRPTFLRCVQLLRESKHGERSQHEDKQIEVRGLIRSVRKQKKFAFAEISDGSSLEAVQAILKPEQAAELSTGAAVQLSGYWTPCPPGKSQTHELQTTGVSYVGAAEPETYPIQKKYHSPDFLRQIPHLRLRTQFNSLLSRFRSECIHQLGNVFRAHPDGVFTQVQPPLITSSDCEGAGETFTILTREAMESKEKPFFGAPKYLTVSSQLHLEAYAAELGNVWTLSPTFRAEKSDTPRHLSEFYMLEAEMNFMYSMDELTDSVEHILRDLTRRLYDSPVGQEVLSTENESSLAKRWDGLMNGPKWQRLTYTEAIQALQEAVKEHGASFEYPPVWEEGLQLEHEKYIVDVLSKGRPVFVTDYPKTVKPFYMLPSSPEASDPSAPGDTVACFDLLLPEVSEVAGGSLREHRLENLISSMRSSGLIRPRPSFPDGESPEASRKSAKQKEKEKEPLYPYLSPEEDLGQLQWYADLRRWGTAPHAGFGLGFDRFLGYLTGVSSVRDVVAFPRHFKRADC